MHCSQGMACVSWKYKRPVHLLSTHALPMDLPNEPVTIVPQRNGDNRERIPTSPMHLE